MTTLLHSATAVDGRGEFSDRWLLLDGDTISAMGTGLERPRADEVVDLTGRWVTPGFLDLHGHGGGGEDYATGDLPVALATHRAHGTTRAVLSLVAEPVDVLEQQLARVARLASDDPLVLGSHLEGPFLAPAQRGAHSAHALRHPDPETIDRLLDAAAGTLRQVTIAPELPGALEAIRRLVAAGVVVAIGHTEADADTAQAAFDAGATLVTHAFNAMPGIHHRSPGPLIAAFEDPRVTLEMILDGRHVDLRVAGLAFAAAAARVAIVTDAMAAAGSADGDYRLGGLDVTVHGGVAMVAGTETLAGSTLTLDAALRIAIGTEMGMSRPDAVRALTSVPARVLGLHDRLGLLEPGFAADVVAFDADAVVTAVWAAGERIV